MCRIEYSKVSNKVFYGLNEDNEGIVMKIKDGAIISVLDRLYAMTTRENLVFITIDELIKQCSYKLDKDNRKKFKDLLMFLREYKLIDFDNIEKSNELIVINTINIVGDDGFFIVLREELEMIENVSTNKVEFNNLLKTYFYLKARCYKRTSDDKDMLCGGRAETTYCSYKNISMYTKISEGKIKDYIEILKDLGLIVYDNCGKKFKPDNPKSKTECVNIYALSMISKDVESELKEGLKQQKHMYTEKGYIITKKDYINNDRKINGRKGHLIKKLKQNTITEEERIELEEIISSQEL